MGKKVELNSPAPNFSLQDMQGNLIELKDFESEKIILLVFNRGLA
jgi:peroxiredoxin